MGDASLRDRLRDHAEAFDGLLSLIPAKMYYGEDTSDQWQRKKQTKAEAAAARRSKLDPDSELNRNAKEVMDERAKNKRKLQELEEENKVDDDDDFESIEGVDAEKPGEGLRKKTAETNKKQKLVEEADNDDQNSKLSKKEEKKAAKKEKKKEKKAEKKSGKSQGATASGDKTEEEAQPVETPAPKPSKARKQKKDSFLEEQPESASNDEPKRRADKGEMTALDVSNLEKDADDTNGSTSHSEPQSPTFDMEGIDGEPKDTSAEPASTTTSISSTIPPSEKPKHIKIPADTAALRARLAAKIEALRAARKADGPDGKPIRTRQELIESRRAKEAQRKAHKKELRKQAKIEEDLKREEALASNSPSVMSPVVELDETTGSFSFGRVAFGDGAQLSHDLSYVLNQGKKKGPSDPKTALLKVQNQKKRLQELDNEKRNDVEEKEAWLTARRRAEGERIRDDEDMLKKAVKRKEVAKKKSEKAWKERAKGVEYAQKEKQRKREDNIKKRREDKMLGKAGKKKKKAGTKKKGRPGFEGSLGVGGRRK